MMGINILKVGGTYDMQTFNPLLRYCKSEGDQIGVDRAYGGGGDFGLQITWETETPWSAAFPSKPDAVNGGDDFNTRHQVAMISLCQAAAN